MYKWACVTLKTNLTSTLTFKLTLIYILTQILNLNQPKPQIYPQPHVSHVQLSQTILSHVLLIWPRAELIVCAGRIWEARSSRCKFTGQAINSVVCCNVQYSLINVTNFGRRSRIWHTYSCHKLFDVYRSDVECGPSLTRLSLVHISWKIKWAATLHNVSLMQEFEHRPWTTFGIHSLLDLRWNQCFTFNILNFK